MSQPLDLVSSASLLAAAIVMTACAREPRRAEPGVTQITAARREPPAADASAATSGGPIVVGRDVLLACALPDEPSEAPLFDFDGAQLRPRGDDILTRVASCAATGRLGGAKLRIVGYTDPRGPAEYNRQLGLYRAEAARQALLDLGVAPDRLVVESRGEREAKGTDEASWQLDRRVEVHLDDAMDGGAPSSP